MAPHGHSATQIPQPLQYQVDLVSLARTQLDHRVSGQTP